jgi:hypothetical protein
MFKGLSRRRFLEYGLAVAVGAGGAARGTSADAKDRGPADGALAALVGLVAASKELKEVELDLTLASARLCAMYRDPDMVSPERAVRLASALDGGTGAFARRGRAQQIDVIRGLLGRTERDTATAWGAPREHVAAALRAAAETLTGQQTLPAPSYTLAPGLVV